MGLRSQPYIARVLYRIVDEKGLIIYIEKRF